MEDIEECFTKFFLQQAVEIDPATVQALIDHGFKSKVALLALDLVHDLPQITEVSLAQKAILRKYIGTLQEYSPLTLSIDEEALKKYKEPSKPNKKRKLEYVEPESSDDEEELRTYFESLPPKGLSQQSNRSTTRQVPALQAASKAQSPGRVAFNGILLPESPVRSQRVSIKYHVMSEEDSDMPAEEEVVEKASSQSSASAAAEPAKKGGRTSKKEVVRTKSQILFEQMKQMRSPPSSETTAIKEVKEEVQSPPAKSPSPPPPTPVLSTRRSVAPTTRTTPARTPSSRRTTIGSSRRAAAQSITFEEEQQPASTPIKAEPKKEAKEPPGHVPTPAELAMRAKIEAKKLADAAKGKRRASKKY